VSAVSATNALAVGEYDNSGKGLLPLVLRCSATACKLVTSALPSGESEGALFGVSADSATDTWAVGYHTYSGTDPQYPLTMHCTGTAVNGITACKQTKSPGEEPRRPRS
jgi:hypothetical protein